MADRSGNQMPQYLLSVIVNILSFTYGTMTGWVSPMQPLLLTNYTNTNMSSPLGENADPLTHEDFSWIGGYFCIGGMVGTLLYGYLANALGRKMTAILAGIPFVAAFSIILYATNAYCLFAARFIAGLGAGGTSVIVPLYVGETAQPSIRGAVGSYFNLFNCLGILSSFIVGSYTSYSVLGMFAVTFPTVFLVASLWLPETPVHSLINNRNDEARSALVKLRGAEHVEVVDRELEQLKISVKEMLTKDKDLSLREVVEEPATRRGLVIGGVLMVVQQLSGISPIINFTVVIFHASGSTVTPHVAAIIVGALQLVGALVGTLLMDRAGRKFLLLFSSVAMALTLAPIAVFFQLKAMDADPDVLQSIGWLPVTCMAVYIVVYALGFGPVPYVLVSELFKTEARSSATSFCVLLVWFTAFLLLKFFSKLQEMIGIASCFATFSFFCVFGAVFTSLYVPETKGKSLETILWELGDTQQKHHSRTGSPIPLVNLGPRRPEIVSINTRLTQDQD